MIEIWKDIKNYEGYYQVSNTGRVKSLERYAKSKNNSTRQIKERILKSYISNAGYFKVILTVDLNPKPMTIHRLVAKAFIGNDLNKKTVNHKNGIKTDNISSNLEWATQSENVQHALSKGFFLTGENCRKSKLKNKEVLLIRSDVKNGSSQYLLSKKYNVSTACIYNIVTRKSWKHI